MNAKKIRVALYARVSTTDQKADLQLDGLRQLAEQRGWTIIEEYVDPPPPLEVPRRQRRRHGVDLLRGGGT